MLSGLFNMVGGLTQNIMQNQVNRENLALQREQYEYQKGLQEKVFGREDNAVQRRIADLKAGGLSPVLAAGQGANAGAVVPTTAPQKADVPDMSYLGNVGSAIESGVMSAIKMKNDISMTNAQKSLIEAQKQQIGVTNLEGLARTRQIGSQDKAIQATTQQSLQQIALQNQHAEYMRQRGYAPNTSMSTSTGQTGTVQAGVDYTTQQARNIADKMIENETNKSPQVSSPALDPFGNPILYTKPKKRGQK